MRALRIAAMSVFIPTTVWIAMSSGQSPTCPPEVASAKAILTARGGEIQASRNQDVQAPRSQGAQAAAPNQDIQAPRNQDIQAPRNQDVQAPRGKVPASGSSEPQRAQTLVKEAEAACKVGDTAKASEKAMAALEILRK